MELTAAVEPSTGGWSLAVDGIWSGPEPSAEAVRIELPPVDPDGADSVRAVAVRLGSGDTVALCARRPAGGRGHDRDEIAVQLTGKLATHTSFDPRLSTEYAPTGEPRRFGIELWLGDDPEGEQHSLRIGGEATPAAAVSPLPQSVAAHPMQAHGDGSPGWALYLLIRGSAR